MLCRGKFVLESFGAKKPFPPLLPFPPQDFCGFQRRFVETYALATHFRALNPCRGFSVWGEVPLRFASVILDGFPFDVEFRSAKESVAGPLQGPNAIAGGAFLLDQIRLPGHVPPWAGRHIDYVLSDDGIARLSVHRHLR